MPKGDRLKLKADPEDGTTPIANLLLEAVAMAKISGLQKGAIIYLWRQTYGWVGKDGKRLKEAMITLSEWKKALDRDKSHIAKALTALQDMNIISRRQTEQWGGYYYSLNTDISSWNSNSINIAKLKETMRVATFATVVKNTTVDPNGNSGGNDNSRPTAHSTVVKNTTPQLSKTPPPTLYKETIKETLKKEDDKNLSSPTGLKIKEVFARLDKIRGYKVSNKRKAEAASIIKMLEFYTPDQIIKTWEILKQDKFWVEKELLMTSVETQIGAMVSRKKQVDSRW